MSIPSSRDERGHEPPELPVPERALRFLADLAREGPVMDRDGEVRRQLLETRGEALGGGAGIDEDERGAMLSDLLLNGPQPLEQSRVRLQVADQRRVEGRSPAARPTSGELERTLLQGDAYLHRPGRRGKEPGDLVRVPHGRREADAADRSPRELVEPLEGERELGAAVRPDQLVDLVDHDRSNVP